MENSEQAPGAAWGKPKGSHDNLEEVLHLQMALKKSQVDVAGEQGYERLVRCFHQGFVFTQKAEPATRAFVQTVHFRNNTRPKAREGERGDWSMEWGKATQTCMTQLSPLRTEASSHGDTEVLHSRVEKMEYLDTSSQPPLLRVASYCVNSLEIVGRHCTN